MNTLRRFRYLPTRRFAALVALTAPAWLLPQPVGLLTLAALFIAVCSDALAIPDPTRLRVRRILPPTVGLGDDVPGQYILESRWPLALTIVLNDTLVSGVERIRPEPATDAPWRIGRVRVPAHDRVSVDIRIRGRQRGEYALGDVVLRVHGPLRLVQRTLRHPLAGALAVVPSITGIRRYRLLTVQHRLRDAGVRSIRRRGTGTAFANLREYVEGDDPRHIEWKASARRGKLITREYTVEQGQTVIVAIDAGRLMTQLSGDVSRFELALASATVLADVATRSGDHVGLLVFDDIVRAFVPPAKGALALRRVREAMVPLRATMTEPDYAGAFRTLATRHRKRSLVVLFCDVVDPRASRTLIAHTVRSAARHLPLVVALQNDELANAAIPDPDRNDALFRSAAAEELLLEREEALTRMRRAGVSVIDTSPSLMTPTVVNRYLALKARAAL